MVTPFALALAASAAAPAPSAPVPPAPRVSVLASAVAVILPVATNDAANDGRAGEGAVHRRLARGEGAVWAVYE